MAHCLLDLTVKSGGEFLKNSPPLKIALITYEFNKESVTIAFERLVEDIELSKEDIKNIIKTLTDFL